MDSGNDALDTLKILMKSGHFFLVKRNLRRIPLEVWADIAIAMGEQEQPREGKFVYTGVYTSAHHLAKPEDELPELDQVFRVTIREIDRDGNRLLFPEIEADVYWTNLMEEPQKIIELYKDHGTSEQFHSELKTDLCLERFPSGKFRVNSLLLNIARIVFNVLQYIGQTALGFGEKLPYKHAKTRKRLRKVISDIVCLSCKVVYHANQWILRLWHHDPWLNVFRCLYRAL